MKKPFSSYIQSNRIISLGFALLLAVAGLFVYALPGGFALEEDIALDFLFKQRQPIPPPESVMLVSIDKAASEQLGLPNDPASWPRDLHARLIDKLAQAGAEVIVFDVFFREAKDHRRDEQLAQAMRQAGNVLIFSRLQREVQTLAEGSEYNLERLVLPVGIIHQAAVATAPFALPRVPVKVNQFWAFHTSAGGLPSLPTVALELYVAQHHTQLLEGLAVIAPQQVATLQGSITGLDKGTSIVLIREFFKQHTAVTQQFLDALRESSSLDFSPETTRRLQALLAVYLGPDRRYLNFYGPPRTIPTVAYHEVLSATETQLEPFKDKVVFVGFAEERQPEQKDSFYTVFSQVSGLDLSGVEIAATAFANLSDQESLRLPGPFTYLAVIALYGLLLALLNHIFSTRLFVFLSLLSAGLYTMLCLSLFARMEWWLPLFVPVILQTSLALFIGLLWRHRKLNHERARIRRAFGYYLPEHVVEKLARSSQQPTAQSERMFGVCLASDAAQYTSLAESMTPDELSVYMNSYYERLFKPVRAHGGVISDVVGDAMLAIWSSQQPNIALRRQACVAALEAIQAEQESATESDLKTRMGLHAGEIMLGNIGALDHYEYRAVGDIVNTASRIEGLNKQLGTSLLVSETVLSGLEGFISRELGAFCMAGKQKPVVIYELRGFQHDNDPPLDPLSVHFTEGLNAYRHNDWSAAIQCFQQALEVSPVDGPSRYYLERCQSHLGGKLPSPKDGVIQLQKK